MTKKIIAAMAFLVVALAAQSQNIQLHYDLGSVLYDQMDKENRPDLTSTVEMFKADKWGSTFFFVDMDYSSDGVEQAYWEIARELRFWDEPISLHLEYNGGINYVNNAYLVGATYTWNSADYSRGWSASAMYKYIEHNDEPVNFQLTATWYVNFCQGKLTFDGYADFWREKHTDYFGKEHEYVFMTEPQLWLNLNRLKGIDPDFNLSVGTEWEISHNFATKDGLYVIPTIALKWTF